MQHTGCRRDPSRFARGSDQPKVDMAILCSRRKLRYALIRNAVDVTGMNQSLKIGDPAHLAAGRVKAVYFVTGSVALKDIVVDIIIPYPHSDDFGRQRYALLLGTQFLHCAGMVMACHEQGELVFHTARKML